MKRWEETLTEINIYPLILWNTVLNTLELWYLIVLLLQYIHYFTHQCWKIFTYPLNVFTRKFNFNNIPRHSNASSLLRQISTCLLPERDVTITAHSHISAFFIREFHFFIAEGVSTQVLIISKTIAFRYNIIYILYCIWAQWVKPRQEFFILISSVWLSWPHTKCFKKLKINNNFLKREFHYE